MSQSFAIQNCSQARVKDKKRIVLSDFRSTSILTSFQPELIFKQYRLQSKFVTFHNHDKIESTYQVDQALLGYKSSSLLTLNAPSFPPLISSSSGFKGSVTDLPNFISTLAMTLPDLLVKKRNLLIKAVYTMTSG